MGSSELYSIEHNSHKSSVKYLPREITQSYEVHRATVLAAYQYISLSSLQQLISVSSLENVLENEGRGH